MLVVVSVEKKLACLSDGEQYVNYIFDRILSLRTLL
jgi:hypothetical protein